MILKLSEVAECVEITAEYSNAVLVALLPIIADFSGRLDLDIPAPLTPEAVALFGPNSWRAVGGAVRLTNGYLFSVPFGYVGTFERSTAYHGLQDPDEVPRFYGSVRMTEGEAACMARDALRRLEIPLADVFADLEPEIPPLPSVGTNIVPRYQVIWRNPWGGKSAQFEVNAEAKRIERIMLRSKALERPPPKVDIVPPARSTAGQPFTLPMPPPPRLNPVFAHHYVPLVLQHVEAYAGKLGLPVPRPLTTNHVAEFQLGTAMSFAPDPPPHAVVELTNGWRFLCIGDRVLSHIAPENVFYNDHKILRVREVAGEWRLSESEAVAVARREFQRLGMPDEMFDLSADPKVTRPRSHVASMIPRLLVEWVHPEESDHVEWQVWAEINMESGTVTGLFASHNRLSSKHPEIPAPMYLNPGADP